MRLLAGREAESAANFMTGWLEESARAGRLVNPGELLQAVERHVTAMTNLAGAR